MSAIRNYANPLQVVTLIMLILGSAYAANPDKESFADCISGSGAKYYAAYWCKYCARQNAMFGSAVRYLPYVECSAKGSRKQLSRCSLVSGYPTWIFADGTKRSSVLSFAELERYTGCKLGEKDYFID